MALMMVINKIVKCNLGRGLFSSVGSSLALVI